MDSIQDEYVNSYINLGFKLLFGTVMNKKASSDSWMLFAIKSCKGYLSPIYGVSGYGSKLMYHI